VRRLVFKSVFIYINLKVSQSCVKNDQTHSNDTVRSIKVPASDQGFGQVFFERSAPDRSSRFYKLRLEIQMRIPALKDKAKFDA
jgi:hypothetical protein